MPHALDGGDATLVREKPATFGGRAGRHVVGPGKIEGREGRLDLDLGWDAPHRAM